MDCLRQVGMVRGVGRETKAKKWSCNGVGLADPAGVVYV